MSCVSIIVRCYNGALTMERCLDSLLAQTYRDFEIIIIDDGSTDNSLEIAQKYAALYSFEISVIPTKHNGIFSATKCGIENSNGEYISFVDVDDYISENRLQIMMDAIKNHKCDIVQCESEFFDDMNCRQTHQKVTDILVLDKDQSLQKLLDGSGVVRHGLAYKIIRKTLFDQVAWNYSFVCEDVGLTYQLLYNSTKIVCLPNVLYHTYRNANSLTRSAFVPSKHDRYYVFDRMRHFFREKNYIDLARYILDSEIRTIYATVGNLYCTNRLKSFRKPLMTQIKGDISALRKEEKFDKKQTLFLFLCVYTPFLWGSAWRLSRK